MVSKKKFNLYRKIQYSGVTNMFDVTTVSKLSGLTKEECFDIMKNYSKLVKTYGEYTK